MEKFIMRLTNVDEHNLMFLQEKLGYLRSTEVIRYLLTKEVSHYKEGELDFNIPEMIKALLPLKDFKKGVIKHDGIKITSVEYEDTTMAKRPLADEVEDEDNGE
jgi:hypothetical protein